MTYPAETADDTREPLADAQAEVETEQEADDRSVVVELRTKDGSVDIRVPDVPDWDAEAIEHLEGRRFMSWARIVLADDDWKKWEDARPTLREANEFFKTWNELSGQDEGKSRPSNRALRRMKRR